MEERYTIHNDVEHVGIVVFIDWRGADCSGKLFAMVVGRRFENTPRGGERRKAQELVEEGDNGIKRMQGAFGMVS